MNDVATLRLDEHLTHAKLESGLAPITAAIDAGRSNALIVDCRTMTGYDHDARALFVDWNSKHRKHLRGVAILTDNRLWWMVITAMALASRQTMRPFSTEPEALAWLGQVGR